MAYSLQPGSEPGDVHDVLSRLDLAELACKEGRVQNARQIVNEARDQITNSMDLMRRPVMWQRLGEVLSQVITLERSLD